MTYSYHIFYFPFKWEIKGTEIKSFSEQVCLDQIHYCNSAWKRVQSPTSEKEKQDLYNEKNYYYQFVHGILYDEVKNSTGLIRHFERIEPQISTVYYVLKVKGREAPYKLLLEAINVNLYATGVGLMSFYVRNEEESQSSPEDILCINQYGRRILPPFYGDISFRGEISEYICIDGLRTRKEYKEDFNAYTVFDSWRSASFITDLLHELSDNICIEPVIDDRMFVASWYKNDELAEQFTCNPVAYKDAENSFSSFWYKYLFVDNSDCETCQDDGMKEQLLERHTYVRWRKWSSLYGISRYSMVYLTNSEVPFYLLDYFQTIYARMIELVLVQRASMLRFSGEVMKVSNLSSDEMHVVSNRISSLYREYIRFLNQIYFREVTAQDQGVELYTMLQSCLKMEEYIKDLDGEIGELHEYVSLKEDRVRNVKASILNNIATLFLPITVITGFWGMNTYTAVITDNDGLLLQSVLLLIGLIGALIVIYNRKRKL